MKNVTPPVPASHAVDVAVLAHSIDALPLDEKPLLKTYTPGVNTNLLLLLKLQLLA
jgi:hypothetical protein